MTDEIEAEMRGLLNDIFDVALAEHRRKAVIARYWQLADEHGFTVFIRQGTKVKAENETPVIVRV